MSREKYNNRSVVGEVVHGIKNITLVGCLALAAYGAYHMYENGLSIGGINLSQANGKAHASGAVIENTYKESKDVIQCSNQITVDVGVNVHSRYMWISGESVNHVYPVRYLMCGKNGFSANLNETIGPKGKIEKIVATDLNYAPTSVGVDFNNGAVLCENLPANSSLKSINQAAYNYRKAKHDHQNVSCNFGAHTTGLGIDTSAQANNDIFVAMQFAQDAGSINPLPENIQNKVDQTIRQVSYNQLHQQYPQAKIEVVLPKPQSPVQAIENNWQANATNIKAGLQSYDVVNKSGHTYFDFKSVYNSAVGQILLPMNLDKQEVHSLNQFMHL
jgi:hypothetical protein